MKKRSRAGESIAETLVAVLIMALVFLMLSTAVTSAVRIDAELKNQETGFSTDGRETTDVALTVAVDAQTPVSVNVKHHRSNGYCYYEYQG